MPHGRPASLLLGLPGLWRLPINCLLPTRKEHGRYLNPDKKDAFRVKFKALI
jgi:hypothetical protein